MSEPYDSPDLSERALRELSAEGAWLERVARALCPDPATASDAAQAAWIQGWQARRAGRPTTRAWMRTAVRHALGKERRSQERAHRRERAAARSEAHDASPSAIERLELQQVVLDALRSLPEPNRTAVVQRYLAGQSVAAIAEQQGCPPKTVRSRLSRGLETLRRTLESTPHGEGRSWLGALALVVPRPSSSTLLSQGALMGLGTKWAAALVTLVFVGWAGFWQAWPRELPTQLERSVSSAGPVLEEPEPELLIASSSEDSRSPSTKGEKLPNQPTILQRGRAMDVQGQPVSGLDVGLWPGVQSLQERVGEPTYRATTDAQGIFSLPAREGGWVDVVESTWAVLYHPVLPALPESIQPEQANSGPLATLTVLPAADLQGIVVDESGQRLPGARLRGEIDFSFYLSMNEGRKRQAVAKRVTTSDATGSFRMERVPNMPGSNLVVSLPGYVSQVVPVDELIPERVEITLERQGAREGHLAGRVVDVLGDPVPGAWVSTGGMSVQVDSEGLFVVRINALPSASEVSLRALAPGFAPAEQEVQLPWEEALTIVLTNQALSIEGTIVCGEGTRPEGLFVWLEGGRNFGSIDQPIDGVSFVTSITYEELLQPAGWKPSSPHPLGRQLAAQPDFLFEGLRDDRYDVHAMDVSTLRRVVKEDIPAGSRNVVLDWEAAPHPRPLGGVALDAQGSPLEGLQVEARFPWQPNLPSPPTWPTVSTDEEGVFFFEDINRDEVELIVRDPRQRVHILRRSLETPSDREELVLELPRVQRIRLEVSDPEYANCFFQALDRDGTPLPIQFVHGERERLSDRAFIQGGRSGVVWFAANRAQTLRLQFREQHLEVPFDLERWPDGVVRVP